MYEPQGFVNLQDNVGFGGDPNSWLSSGDNASSPTNLHRTDSALSNSTTAGTGSNVDRVLFKDLVEIVPLVQSLIDRKASTSFTRRGSMIYTKTPARESLSKKTIEPKGKAAAQSIPTKKRRDPGEKDQGADSFSVFSSRALPTEKDREELIALREQVEDLKRKLMEKDELLKSAEISKQQMTSIYAELDELNHRAAEKDSLLKSTQLQLSDAKIKLADKQAAVEKLQWEAMTSSRKVEKLQEELDSMQGEISSYMVLVDGLTKHESSVSIDYSDFTPDYLDHISDIEDVDEIEMEKAREAYTAAVAAAKLKQDEESIAAAARARIHLQSFILKTNP